MTRGRRYRRSRNGSTSTIFPSMNSTAYQGSNNYPYQLYANANGTGGGYLTGSLTGSLSPASLFGNYISDMNIVICNGFKLVGNSGYLLLKNSHGSELIKIDGEGMYKYHFFSGNGYDMDEDGALIILDEGSL